MLLSRHRYSDQIPQVENLETNENVEANLTGNVISLYSQVCSLIVAMYQEQYLIHSHIYLLLQCLALLARFTHCFESLTDFPSDFGKEIFELAVTFSFNKISLLLPTGQRAVSMCVGEIESDKRF